jgi:dethiobiotin synthetase/adenosylmethionine--8-amino-7-oxononanoate aminotransferase
LVGDGRLGGISATLSAYDSLALRGHQVPLVVLMDDGQLANSEAIRQQLRGTASVLAFPVCQPPPLPAAWGNAAQEQAQGQQQQQQIDASLAEWLAASALQFDALLWLASQSHRDRLDKLAAAAGDARRMLWWPFTQHASLAGDGAVTVIDGRVGESFCVYKPAAAAAPAAGDVEEAAVPAAAAGSGGDRLELMFDACASWWTQGVSAAAVAAAVLLPLLPPPPPLLLLLLLRLAPAF